LEEYLKAFAGVVFLFNREVDHQSIGLHHALYRLHGFAPGFGPINATEDLWFQLGNRRLRRLYQSHDGQFLASSGLSRSGPFRANRRYRATQPDATSIVFIATPPGRKARPVSNRVGLS
jgi:hypothetical protein